MLLNEKLTSDLLNAWVEDQNHPSRGRANRIIPALHEFEIFLDTLFQASLLQEEGISISTSVAWISKGDFQKHELPKRRETELCLYFDSPINFEARNLAKMNGIANGNSSTLLAYGAKNNNEIWGICYYEPSNEALGSIPASASCMRHFSPDCPTITISGIGSLRVTRADNTIGRIENGRFIPAHPEVFMSTMLGKYLYKLIAIDLAPDSQKFKNVNDSNKATLFMSCIKYLIKILSQRKLGSTVILVPDSTNARKYFECSWSVTGSLEIDVIQEFKVNNSNDQIGGVFDIKASGTLQNRLRNLADLAKMDGALLISPDFKVIGFGAKLKALKWEREIQCGPMYSTGASQTLDFTRLGTRHNSALNFVGSVDGSIAFVASSDGPIRALTKDEQGKIVYWSDCRISMFK